MKLRATMFLIAALLFVPGTASAVAVRGARTSEAKAVRMAEFILGMQDANGAIPDEPGGRRVNEDSNMEYALIAVGAAYECTGEAEYLAGLERGIRWLALREEMADPKWKGSWRYAYSSEAPYDPIPTSPGPGVTDVRGVDATSALFVYLIYLHRQLSGSDALATSLAPNAKAALDFALANNRAADGFFWSSWQLRDGVWRLWKFQYAADQGDVYLGMRAGSLLYGAATYTSAADFLEANIQMAFFDERWCRYGLGRDRSGSLDPALEHFNGIFPQGYLPWIFGDSAQNRAAYSWLRTGINGDGSVSFEGGPAYSLSAAMVGMAAGALGKAAPARVLRWLTTVPFDRADGGVRDTDDPRTPEYTNVVAFSALSLLGFKPFV